jgi:hypothetical protein
MIISSTLIEVNHILCYKSTKVFCVEILVVCRTPASVCTYTCTLLSHCEMMIVIQFQCCQLVSSQSKRGTWSWPAQYHFRPANGGCVCRSCCRRREQWPPAVGHEYHNCSLVKHCRRQVCSWVIFIWLSSLQSLWFIRFQVWLNCWKLNVVEWKMQVIICLFHIRELVSEQLLETKKYPKLNIIFLEVLFYCIIFKPLCMCHVVYHMSWSLVIQICINKINFIWLTVFLPEYILECLHWSGYIL